MQDTFDIFPDIIDYPNYDLLMQSVKISEAWLRR